MDIDAFGLMPAPSFGAPLEPVDATGRAVWRCTSWDGTQRLRCFERPRGSHPAGAYLLLLPSARGEPSRRIDVALDGRERMLLVWASPAELVIERVREPDGVVVGPPHRNAEGDVSVEITTASAAWCQWGGYQRGRDVWTSLGWRTGVRERRCQCGQCGQPEPIRAGDVWLWPSVGERGSWVRLDQEIVAADPVRGCDREALLARARQELAGASEEPIVRDVWSVMVLLEPERP